MAKDNINEESGGSSNVTISFGDPLFLHPNDTSRAPIISFKLTWSENYNMWNCAMKFALKDKSKLHFIDGS